MNVADRFDDITRIFATPMSRRKAFGLAVKVLVTGASVGLLSRSAFADDSTTCTPLSDLNGQCSPFQLCGNANCCCPTGTFCCFQSDTACCQNGTQCCQTNP